jgi:hypothetical protein
LPFVASILNAADLKQRRHGGGGKEAEPVVTKFKKRKKTKVKRQALSLGYRPSTPSTEQVLKKPHGTFL